MTSPARITERAVRQVVDSWKAAPAVEVVVFPDDLPFPVPYGVKGVFMPRSKKVWLVSSVQTPHEALRTLAHESIGHHGLREMFAGRSWFDFMRAVRAGAIQGDPALIAIRSRVRSNYTDNDGQYRLHPILEADEVTAAAAETLFSPVLGRLAVDKPFRKLWAAWSGRFARDHLHADVPIDFRQLEGALLGSEHRLRHGGRLWGIPRKVRDWHTAAMASPKWNPRAKPMALDESERLLAAEKNRRAQRGQWSLVGNFVLFLGALILFFGGIAVIAWTVITPFFR